MWTTTAISLSLYVGRIGHRPHLGHLGCLFGLAVECATSRLSTRTGLSAEPNRVRIWRGVQNWFRRVSYRINILGSQRGFDGVLINL